MFARILLCLLAVLLPVRAQNPSAAVESCFREEGVTGCMALYDEAHGWREYRPELTHERFVPASTFKIPNTLIGLETGVLPMQLAWDGVVRGNPGWDRDQDLASAFKASAAWYYQEMARRVGLEREKSWVVKLDYGNMHVGDRVDQFWLDGPLKISPREQVLFLRRLHDDELPVRASSRRKLIRIMDQGEGIHAKTGWARTPAMEYGWYVGWQDRTDGPVYFALLITQPPPAPKDFYELRIRLAKKVLSTL